MLPPNALALLELDPSVPGGVLQERSSDRRHDFGDVSLSWKHKPSSPVGKPIPRLGGNPNPGNIRDQLGSNSKKSEDRINKETKRLLHSLQRCQKYKKYRERRPRNAKEWKQRWSDKKEEAFFRALVRWPPMGHRKLILDGQLRGRNQLVAGSIQEETGQPQNRKRVSSHIQVLRKFFSDRPDIAIYLSTEDRGERHHHASERPNHLRSLHGSSQSKYHSPVQPISGAWDDYGYPSRERCWTRQEDTEALPLDFQHQCFTDHLGHLDLESGTLEGMGNSSDLNSATAPSLAVDYFQLNSLPNLAQSYNINIAQPHDIDTTGSYSDVFPKPAINLGRYESYCDASTPNPLEHGAKIDLTHNHGTFEDLGLDFTMASCYPTTPSWPHQDPTSWFEGTVEQAQNPLDNRQSEDIAWHNDSHDGKLSSGLLELWSGFSNNAGVWADYGGEDELLLQMHGHASFNMIESDQHTSGDTSRAF